MSRVTDHAETNFMQLKVESVTAPPAGGHGHVSQLAGSDAVFQ